MHSVAFDKQTLPVPSTTPIGRTRELDQIREALLKPGVRLLTLIGPGGVGKTRLALQAANEIRTASSRTVHFVSLANASDESAVLSAVAHELSIYQEAATPSETTVQQRTERRIEAAIGERAVFLVLDNAEGVVDHLIFVPRLLKACPNLQILVTSQIMLRLSAEHVVPVHPLPTSVEVDEDLAPASALFIEHARAVRPDLRLDPEDLRVIDTICQQLDGLPLAIETGRCPDPLLDAGCPPRPAHRGAPGPCRWAARRTRAAPDASRNAGLVIFLAGLRRAGAVPSPVGVRERRTPHGRVGDRRYRRRYARAQQGPFVQPDRSQPRPDHGTSGTWSPGAYPAT